jgi:hypothetical protein
VRKQIENLLAGAYCVRLLTDQSQRYFTSWSVVHTAIEDVYTLVARNEDDSFEVVVLVVDDGGIFRWGYCKDEPRSIKIEAVSFEENELLKKAYADGGPNLDEMFKEEN